MKNKLIIIAAIVSLLFGVLTIFAGGSVILDLFGMREREGNYVTYVVWASFISGILYVFASYGFFKNRAWTKTVLQYAIYILIAGFVALIVWILKKEPYETAIIFKLSFRILLSVGLFWVAKSIKN
ncbi:MAG TPA: hypothetical protein VFI29_21685 [Hanamia sp.]|nr:hypothetical protein [Hanamia sp.]